MLDMEELNSQLCEIKKQVESKIIMLEEINLIPLDGYDIVTNRSGMWDVENINDLPLSEQHLTIVKMLPSPPRAFQEITSSIGLEIVPIDYFLVIREYYMEELVRSQWDIIKYQDLFKIVRDLKAIYSF